MSCTAGSVMWFATSSVGSMLTTVYRGPLLLQSMGFGVPAFAQPPFAFISGLQAHLSVQGPIPPASFWSVYFGILNVSSLASSLGYVLMTVYRNPPVLPGPGFMVPTFDRFSVGYIRGRYVCQSVQGAVPPTRYGFESSRQFDEISHGFIPALHAHHRSQGATPLALYMDYSSDIVVGIVVPLALSLWG